MATEYPNGNPGFAPLIATSDVGRFRLLFGDTEFEPYDPEAGGYGNYKFFSDDQIEAFLASGGTDTRAIGFAYLNLAGAAAVESRSVKDHDLAVDLTKRSSDLRAIAQGWFERADAEDDADGNGDIFEVFDMVTSIDPIAEGTMPIYGRSYTWGPL